MISKSFEESFSTLIARDSNNKHYSFIRTTDEMPKTAKDIEKRGLYLVFSYSGISIETAVKISKKERDLETGKITVKDLNAIAEGD